MEYYLWIKAVHVLAFVSWMAGMLYLPRLFVYHAGVSPGSETAQVFAVMERRLLRYIMNPAMIVTFASGVLMIAFNPEIMSGGWLHAKLTLVFIMAGAHGFFAMCRKKFEHGENKFSANFYRWANEGPTVLLIGIVILAVVRPF